MSSKPDPPPPSVKQARQVRVRVSGKRDGRGRAIVYVNYAGKANMPVKYVQLSRENRLSPIATASEHKKALKSIGLLAGTDMGTRQRAWFESLCVLVEDYERKNHTIDTSGVTPLEALEFLLEENGMSGSDLGRLLGGEGSRSLGSKILRGERELSKSHIKTLAERFKVSPALFLE